jgi:hypothetical protein
MHVGTAIFLIAMIYFAINYPGFRKLLLACAGLVAAAILIWTISIVHDNREKATYRPTSAQQAAPLPDDFVPDPQYRR